MYGLFGQTSEFLKWRVLISKITGFINYMNTNIWIVGGTNHKFKFHLKCVIS